MSREHHNTSVAIVEMGPSMSPLHRASASFWYFRPGYVWYSGPSGYLYFWLLKVV